MLAPSFFRRNQGRIRNGKRSEALVRRENRLSRAAGDLSETNGLKLTYIPMTNPKRSCHKTGAFRSDAVTRFRGSAGLKLSVFVSRTSGMSKSHLVARSSRDSFLFPLRRDNSFTTPG